MWIQGILIEYLKPCRWASSPPTKVRTVRQLGGREHQQQYRQGQGSNKWVNTIPPVHPGMYGSQHAGYGRLH